MHFNSIPVMNFAIGPLCHRLCWKIADVNTAAVKSVRLIRDSIR